MAQERITVLRMLEEGKITVDEATALLDVIEQPNLSEEQQIARPPVQSFKRDSLVQSRPSGAGEGDLSGVDLTKMTEMKIHGVTPEFIERIRHLGFTDLSMDKLVEMRIHGVTPDYVLEIRAAGLDPSVNQLIEMRIHGVTPEYIRQMEALGVGGITLDRLIEMRIHGVDAEYLKRMNKLG